MQDFRIPAPYIPKKADEEYVSGAIKLYNNFLSYEKCDDLINIFQNELNSKWDGRYYRDGSRTSGVTRGITANPDKKAAAAEKNSLDFNIKAGTKHIDLVRWLDLNSMNLYGEYIYSFLRDMQDDIVLPNRRNMQILSEYLGPTFNAVWQIQYYKQNEGHFNNWHTDETPSGVTIYKHPATLDSDSKKPTIHTPRLAVIIIYLNDVDDGGETEFKLFDVTIKPKKGTAIIFPTTFPFYHRGAMPLSSDKYIITSWFQYDPTGVIAPIYKDSSPDGWPFNPVPRGKPMTMSTVLNRQQFKENNGR